VDVQGFADAPPDRHPRVETGERVLEDDAGLPSERGALRVGHLVERRPVEGDGAAGGLPEAEYGLARGRLPAAGLADEPERLTLPDVE